MTTTNQPEREPVLLANLDDMQCPDEANHVGHGWWPLDGQPYFCRGFIGRAGVPVVSTPAEPREPATGGVMGPHEQLIAEENPPGFVMLKVTAEADAAWTELVRKAMSGGCLTLLPPDERERAAYERGKAETEARIGWSQAWDAGYAHGKAEGIAEGRRQMLVEEAATADSCASLLDTLPGQDREAGCYRVQAEHFRNKLAGELTGGSDAA